MKKEEKKLNKLLKKTVLKEEKRRMKSSNVDSILKGRDFFENRAPQIRQPPRQIDNTNTINNFSKIEKPEIKNALVKPIEEVKKIENKNSLPEKEKTTIAKIAPTPHAEDKNKSKSPTSMTKNKGIPNRTIYFIAIISLAVLCTGYYFLTMNVVRTLLIFFGVLILFIFSSIVKKRLEYYGKIKKMEAVFPDFISLMSSNLRAGMTIDRALLLSSRKEFAPLDKEILKVGKDILTAKEISAALNDMAKRINSEEITKTIQLIISGIRSGGNLSVLLEETANNMRERIFVKKRASSNVLMYVIFIFFAVAVGAPLLFGLSSVLVELMTNIFSGVSVENVNLNLPFTLTQINISTTFIFYFSILFMIVSSVMASLVLGLVGSGKERDGLKYTLILIISSIVVFLVSRGFLLKYFSGVAK